MKMHLQDNVVRIRLSLKEVERLLVEKKIESCVETSYQDARQPDGSLSYGVRVDESTQNSWCEISSNGIWLVLSNEDCERLNQPDQEGISFRDESKNNQGPTASFRGCVEKDRPPSKLKKPEKWVTDHASDNNLSIGEDVNP